MTYFVHYIKAWTGKPEDEQPLCGEKMSRLRTVEGTTLDSAYQPMNICAHCKALYLQTERTLERT